MRRDPESDLANIYNALAESVLEMSDEEIEEEIRDEGLEPGEVAAHVRQVMRQAVQDYQDDADIKTDSALHKAPLLADNRR